MGCLRLVGRQGFFQLFNCFKDNFESLRWRRPHSTAVHQSVRVAEFYQKVPEMLFPRLIAKCEPLSGIGIVNFLILS